jgi:hypothetical protein
VLCAYTDDSHRHDPHRRRYLNGRLQRRAAVATITFHAGFAERGSAVLPGGYTSTSTAARRRRRPVSHT